jgi:hypothetical protein
MRPFPQSCSGFPYAPTLVPFVRFVRFVATPFLEMPFRGSMRHLRKSEILKQGAPLSHPKSATT